MTVRELIKEYKRTHEDEHFFDTNTLNYWGEKINKMRISSEIKNVKDFDGTIRQCYMISVNQDKAPTQPFKVRHYFEVSTFDWIATVTPVNEKVEV